MTYSVFIYQIKSYYGQYQGKTNVETYVMRYLSANIEESRLGDLYAYVLYAHPVNYGAPDIAAIESAIDRAREKGQRDIRLFVDPLKAKVKKERNHMPKLTEQERAEGERILEEVGGLKGLFANLREKGSTIRRESIGGDWVSKLYEDGL